MSIQLQYPWQLTVYDNIQESLKISLNNVSVFQNLLPRQSDKLECLSKSVHFFQDAGSQQIGFLLGSCGVALALTSDACFKGLPKTTTGEVVNFKGWPKLFWFITEHLPKPPKDWLPPPRLTDDTPAYVEVILLFSCHFYSGKWPLPLKLALKSTTQPWFIWFTQRYKIIT